MIHTGSHILEGFSYWKVELTSGKELTEDALSFDFIRGIRNIDWALDLVSTGDVGKIRELKLCTPHGVASLPILEPYTAFQLKVGTKVLLGGSERVLQAHIIGRVDDRETGKCTAVIWDVIEQKLYLDYSTSIRNFKRWRDGVSDLGELSISVLGVRLA